MYITICIYNYIYITIYIYAQLLELDEEGRVATVPFEAERRDLRKARTHEYPKGVPAYPRGRRRVVTGTARMRRAPNA